MFWTKRAGALASGAPDANAMSLATATPGGAPSVRMVLLKGFDARGFVFFTNYESRKSRELDENPEAALCLYWRESERQVRITGGVERTSEAESDEYFRARPAGSRIGAAASPQSAVIPGRTALEAKVAWLTARYPDGSLPRPLHWGGFRVVPEVVEFWQGRSGRLRDRIRYRNAHSTWVIERLAP